MKKLILIDANSIIHRAFHALPSLKSPNGFLTNAIFGFSSIILKMIKELEPDYIIATYDLPSPTFRHKVFEEYKVHRPKIPGELASQIAYTKDILRAFGIQIYEKEGYEADDLIGSLAERLKKIKDIKIIIVSGDLDTLQLVDNKKVVVYTLKKGLTDAVIYDQEMVLKRYGLKPEQLPDFKGLKGDPSDNIPGVPGIGEKLGSEILKRFGTIENLYNEIQKPSKREKIKGAISEKIISKLLKYKDQALFSKHLATIVKDLVLDIEFEKIDWKKNYNKANLENIFRELGFSSLVPRIPNIENKSQNKEEIFIERESINEEIVSEKEELKKLKNKIKKFSKFAFDISENKLVLAIIPDIIYVIGLELIKDLEDLFEDEKILKITHDLKNSIKKLNLNHQKIKGYFDTQIAVWVLNSDLKEPTLEQIWFSEFGRSIFKNKDSPIYILRLFEILWDRLKSANLLRVFEEIEMPLIPVLVEMELNGIKIDSDALESLNKFIGNELIGLENEIFRLSGINFNINSPQQLSEVLFNRLKIKGKLRKTAGGIISTAASELEKLRDTHPIIDLVLKYRELQKLKTTYIDPFPEFINQKDGRLHTNFIQTGTVTGRLASQNPNLQNIPIRTELGQEFRKSFVADENYNLVSLDYSQIELRIAAHISGDENMTSAFKRGDDIHIRTASKVFDRPPDQVTTEMRRQAKALNFGVIYGMGALGFSRASGISQAKAREFIEKYLREFPKIAEYMEETKEKARRYGVVHTLFGRQRIIPEIYSSIPELVRQAERMAINFPIQGTLADIMKMAMIKIFNYIHKNLKENEAKILIQIHDELLFEIKEELVDQLAKDFKEIMENIYKLSVPLVVEVKKGKNWGEMSKLF